MLRKLLSEESRSGSELMDLIEERSGGLWRPSPGSIYPLLEWLRDRGYVKEAQTGDINVRRYSLTEKGRKFLEEQREIKAFMMRTWRLFAPYVLDTFFYKTLNDKQHELIQSVRMFMQTLFSLQSKIWEEDNKMCILIMTIGGAIAGLKAIGDLTYRGIILGLVCLLNPIAAIPTSIFIGSIIVGATVLVRRLRLPFGLDVLFLGIVSITFATFQFFYL